VVAGDALQTPWARAAQRGAAGGASRWTVKHNHPTRPAASAAGCTADDTTVAGGRIVRDLRSARLVAAMPLRHEIRTLTASGGLTGYGDWPGLGQVFQVDRQRMHTKRGKVAARACLG
jgi:hypothetical protein